MKIEEILSALQNLNANELSRVYFSALALMKDESRLGKLRVALRPGMLVSYFCVRENRFVKAIVKAVKQTKVLLAREDMPNTIWSVSMQFVNVDNIEAKSVPVSNKLGSLHRYNLQVGDSVGFELKGQEVFGVVKKLNPTRAQIVLPCGAIWNVGYKYLFPICEGAQASACNFIEGEVIDA